MIYKILWASDDSEDSNNVLSLVKVIEKVFNSEIIGLYVIPDRYEVEVMENFPAHESELLTKWINETESKQSDRFNVIAGQLKEEGTPFRQLITQGTPYLNIIKSAEEENADLIIMGKGRADKRYIMGATALKVLRRSPVPVLIYKEDRELQKIEKILVPTDMYNIISRDLLFALDISKKLGAELYCLNVLETGRKNLPPELLERLRGNAYSKLTQQITDAGFGEDVETVVKKARNAFEGIDKFVKDKDIDLIIMNTYGGGKFRREEFIGSVAERLVQEAPSPVITIKPE